MNDLTQSNPLTDREKKALFWASFLSLAAAGFGFAFRVAKGGDYGAAFDLTNLQIGMIFGASLWPIAITMIGFSLVVDRTGYKLPMIGAFALQTISGVGTYLAGSYGELYFAALCAGLGHGIVEAVINPVCAAVYPKEKTKWLTILHAAWPAGLVAGTLLIIGSDALTGGLSWNIHALWIVLPALGYAVLYRGCRFPVDERVQAGIPYIEMLRQVGFLGAALAGFLLTYEIGNQVAALSAWEAPENWFGLSAMIGLWIGAGYGFLVKGVGRPLFFLMCLLMIPVATAELGTDAWIKKLMTPVLEDLSWNPAMALVFSASIMLIFRVFAGGILKFFSPPALLTVSGVFSAVGLYWLSGSAGAAVFVAFTLYAMGQTFYWPCVLGFVSERYPQGGALTLNTVSAIGLLSAGIIGGQILGVAFDESIHKTVAAEAPAMAEASSAEKSFLWMKHDAIMPEKMNAYVAGLEGEAASQAEAAFAQADDQAGRDVLKFAAWFPITLILAFGAITLWFRARGGYRPVVLEA